MCLLALALNQHPRFPWVLAANRDEFFDRPSASLAWWPGQALLGGQDLRDGGTWLALTPQGRLAMVTNVREPGREQPGLPSRGGLVLEALREPAPDLVALRATPRNGFNLLVADLAGTQAQWLSNRAEPGAEQLAPGVHGLSNAALNTPWPKLQRLRERLGAAVLQADAVPTLVAQALAALADGEPAPDAELPATGLPLERERQLSSAFIRIADAQGLAVYGTRCSTVVVVEQVGAQRRVHVRERRFDAAAQVAGESSESWALG